MCRNNNAWYLISIPKLLARDGYNWFLRSFVLKNVWSNLLALGNFPFYLKYTKLMQISRGMLDRALEKIQLEESALHGHFKDTRMELLIGMPQLVKIGMSRDTLTLFTVHFSDFLMLKSPQLL